MVSADVVIVGGGQAGAQAAIGLKEARFSGSVLLLTQEPDDSYQRPPLSKRYLECSQQFDWMTARTRTDSP